MVRVVHTQLLVALLSSIAGLNILDLALVALLAYSLYRGTQLGAAVQLGSYGGFLVGLALGTLVAPHIGHLFPSGFARTAVSLAIFFGFASIVSRLGHRLGMVGNRSLKMVRLGTLDAGLGAGISLVATVVSVWVVAALALNSSFVTVSNQVATSKVVRLINNVLPPAPSFFTKLDQLLGSSAFPSVFAAIPPQLAGPVTLPSSATVNSVAQKVEQSTVKVEGVGCGGIQEGSGFVAAAHIVVTNAHVVAGIASPYVSDSAGDHAAKVIFFDPRFDLAILDVPTLSDPVLHISSSEVGRGTQAVILGYPEGGPLTIGSAGVMASFEARGRDIYNQGLTVRAVYQVEAIVRPGNSGGPLVDTNGNVIGVIFSRSTTNTNVGFALASPEVASDVSAHDGGTTAVSTGACTGG